MSTFRIEDFEEAPEGETSKSKAKGADDDLNGSLLPEGDDDDDAGGGARTVSRKIAAPKKDDEGDGEDEGDGGDGGDGGSAAPQVASYESIILQGEHIPQELQGINVTALLNTYATQKDMMRQLLTQPAAPSAGGTESDADILAQLNLTEEELGVGSNPASVQDKLSKLLEAKVGPVIRQQQFQILNTRSLLNMTQAREVLPHFKKYEAEIVMEASKKDVTETANPQTWKDLHDMVVARHQEEIIAERLAEGSKRPKPQFSERGKGKSGGGSDKKRSTLSDEQRRVLKGLQDAGAQITEEQYLARVQKED